MKTFLSLIRSLGITIISFGLLFGLIFALTWLMVNHFEILMWGISALLFIAVWSGVHGLTQE